MARVNNSSSKTPSQKNKRKSGLHPRNPHAAPYDIPRLVKVFPKLAEYTYETPRGVTSIRFAEPKAVKLLNQALLSTEYNIQFWDFPEGYLCPPIPGRADYLHYIADLLAESNGGKVPVGAQVQGLDVGTGANCIYPLIGSQSYGWKFVGSDIDPVSVACAEQIVKANPVLKGKLTCRLQPSSQQVFQQIIKPSDRFAFTMCNPPFHASLQEATQGTKRKIRNLNRGKQPSSSKEQVLNFAGQGAELWCKGGEIAFVKQMIKESAEFAEQSLWFSCLISKKENLPQVNTALKKVRAKKVKTIEMHQGQKITRVVAWSFYDEKSRKEWFNQA
ncbi:23S rRNA (adenine(1618)-N(6))-methyltransferase RlmF [Neptuniibacter sp. SY11_33]|uniref:23S rRNA (adenine(1618)-N(6))-methyltransferase RlmF n=1 Tax=Neptuniibacter sp. SY11_33 TaxID=3398215 RepID=UPI0039F4AEBD